jgi:serine/threonine-protein kinase
MPPDPTEDQLATEAEEVDELIGRSIGSYQITRPLGRGGMGAVYMAEHPGIGSRVAIKFLHPQYATNQKIVDRFFNEARAVNVIGHDNILKIIDLNVTEDHRHYFIMEFLHGKALQDIMQPGVAVPLEVAGPILLQICEALQAAHEQRIVHRDLKPDNVYLIVHKGRKNFVKVVDFGIAKLTDDQGISTGKTQTGTVMGTPAYMSPEQAGGMTNRIDGRSDVYSLGVMMFQMATGSLPFAGTSFGEVLIGHLQIAPPEPRTLNPAIPEEYQGIVLKCLAKPQDERFQTMRELHDAIASCMEALGITRELPRATAADEKAAHSPLRARTVSSVTRTPVHATAPGPQKASAPRTRPAARPIPPKKKSVGLHAALGVIAFAAVGGGVGFTVHQISSARRAQEELAAQLQKEQRGLEAARKKAEADAAARNVPPPEAPLTLTISSMPGANIVARWGEGIEKRTQSVLEVSLPKGTAVHVEASLAGYQTLAQDVVMGSNISVPMLLKRLQRRRQPQPEAPKGEEMPIELEDFGTPK